MLPLYLCSHVLHRQWGNWSEYSVQGKRGSPVFYYSDALAIGTVVQPADWGLLDEEAAMEAEYKRQCGHTHAEERAAVRVQVGFK